METKAEILQLLQQYIVQYPAEKQDVQGYIDFVSEHEGDQLFDRKNFNGHITASAFIINNEANALLLLKHKALNRWLQPGGHVDRSDSSLMNAALREAEEETGISLADLIPVDLTVFDFDSHFIPENRRKQEPGHYHHDIRFLFKCSKPGAIDIAKEESTDSTWMNFEDLVNHEDFGRVVRKTKSLIDLK